MTAPRPHPSLRSLRDRWHVVATRRKTLALQVFRPGNANGPAADGNMQINPASQPAENSSELSSFPHGESVSNCSLQSRLGSYDDWHSRRVGLQNFYTPRRETSTGSLTSFLGSYILTFNYRVTLWTNWQVMTRINGNNKVDSKSLLKNIWLKSDQEIFKDPA